MSTSGWSLPARAKTRGLGCPLHSRSQLAPSLYAWWEKVFFLKGQTKLVPPVQSKGLYLNIR